MSASGGYQLVRILGTGVGGAVYLAEVAGRKVAIRQFVSTSAPDSQAASFERQQFLEAGRQSLTLKHPRIVPVLEVIDEGSEAFVAMEYMEAETLRVALAARNFTQNEANTLLRQIAMALDFAHEHGVVHGDLKPGDIFLHGQGAKVSDFAISPRAHLDPGKPIAPTLLHAYLSPEHVRNPESVNAQSDQYALAIMAYELYTGHSPYGEGIADLGSAILDSQIAAPSRINPQIPLEADAPLMRALSPDPAQRFGSCMEFVAALGAAMITQPDGGMAPRSRKGWYVAAALLVLAAGAGGYYLLSARKTAPPLVAVTAPPPVAPPARLPETVEVKKATKMAEKAPSTLVKDRHKDEMRSTRSPFGATPPPPPPPPYQETRKTRDELAGNAASTGLTHGRNAASAGLTHGRNAASAGLTQGRNAASAGLTQGKNAASAGLTQGKKLPPGVCPAASVADSSFQIQVFSETHEIHDGDTFQVGDSLLGRMAEGDLRATVMPTGAQVPRGSLKMEWRVDNVVTARLPVPAIDSIVVYGNKPMVGNYNVTLTRNGCPVSYFHFRITPSQP